MTDRNFERRTLPLIGVRLLLFLPRGGTETRERMSLHLSEQEHYMTKRTIQRIVRYSIRMEVEILVKVKAYKRIRNGKVEKVRSYYRRY